MDNLMTGLSMSLIGMVIVLSILGILAVIVSFLKYIGPKESGENADSRVAAEIIEESVETGEQPSDEDAEDFSPEIVAAITAAVCSYTGTGPDGFRINAVKRVSGWNNAAKREHQNRLL